MRGEHLSRINHIPHDARFIPACAGNTYSAPKITRLDAVHPRMRGEHTAVLWMTWLPLGSSPHARGTRRRTTSATAPSRFIPACAGNTVAGPPPRFRCAVHPRMRGEHIYLERYWLQPGGSSPHARGTRISLMTGRPPRRFIPACAGNTLSRTFTSVIMAVHPRMRGEHLALDIMRNRGGGSSPHARGTPTTGRTDHGPTRFIPACAGNTVMLQTAARRGPVHPRMRGEHLLRLQRRREPYGSSPHARGTRQ